MKQKTTGNDDNFRIMIAMLAIQQRIQRIWQEKEK